MKGGRFFVKIIDIMFILKNSCQRAAVISDLGPQMGRNQNVLKYMWKLPKIGLSLWLLNRTNLSLKGVKLRHIWHCVCSPSNLQGSDHDIMITKSQMYPFWRRSGQFRLNPPSLNQGCQIWYPNWFRLAPNVINLGLFRISFSTFGLTE